MANDPKCPQCSSDNAYHDGSLWTCPDCSHEWNESELKVSGEEKSEEAGVRDAHGNPLVSGDSVTVIKDLKLKGSSLVLKGGTKIKNIRVIDGEDGHNLACKVDGIGAMNLKSEFVKKA